jgi:hypothetical protein
MRTRVLACGAAGVLVAAAAAAQTVDVERASTFAVGLPAAGARADRVDAARTGRTREALPSGTLRVEWRAPIGAPLEAAPVVDAKGTTYVVGNRGEVVAIARDGSELWRVSTGATQPGPAALLADDTLVFADRLGEAVAVRGGFVRWRSLFGRSDTARLAPLPLDDGGVVVATAHDLASLDSGGRERGRVAFSETLEGPLVGALGKVVVVAQSGAVWTWTPGAPEPTRLGSFGEPVAGGAALGDDHTLLAVTAGGSHLSALDLVRGVASTRATAPSGLWIGSPAIRAGTTFVELLAPTGQLLLGIDASGAEIARVPLATRMAPIANDGGVAPLVSVPIASPLVDGQGAIAFATVEGGLGVASGSSVDLLPDGCAPGIRPRESEPPAAGLAPLGAGAFVAACRSGSVVAIHGTAGNGRGSHL